MKRKTKGWSEERRQKQAETCRKTKPWKQSTGPKTQSGKDAVAQNALKHGMFSEDVYYIKALLRRQAAFLRSLKTAQSIVDKTPPYKDRT